LYCFGGFDGVNQYFGLAVFDPVTLTWTNPPTQGEQPILRTNHAATNIGSKMIIYGGNRTENDSYTILEDLQIFDVETMTWSQPQTTGCRPCARSGHSLTAIGHKLFLFGGGVWNERQGWVEKFNDVYVLDTHTMNWTKPQCSGTVETSTFPITFAIGRYLFVFGGGSRPKHCVTNDLHLLDTATYTWSMPQVEGTKPQPRDMGTACVVGNTVYFFGGYAGGAVDYFDKLVFEAPPLFQ